MVVRCLSLAIALGCSCLLKADGFQPMYMCDGDPRPLWLPEVKLKGATLDDAISYLRAETKRLDITTRTPTGINVVVKDPLGKIDRKKRVSLDLHDVRVADALWLVAYLLDAKVSYEPYAVVFVPKDAPERMRTLHILVPPDTRHLVESLH